LPSLPRHYTWEQPLTTYHGTLAISTLILKLKKFQKNKKICEGKLLNVQEYYSISEMKISKLVKLIDKIVLKLSR
jgi:hypothetical protein